MTREQIQQRFVAEFHRGEMPSPVSDEDLRQLEQNLGTILPQSYISFMRVYGKISTPEILDMVVDAEAEPWALAEIWTAAECIEATRMYWSGGMSQELVGFASDVMGNLFCFRQRPPDTARPDDAEVWLFDHDFCKESKLADSFDEWLFSYLRVRLPELVR